MCYGRSMHVARSEPESAGRRVGPVRGTSDLPNEIRLRAVPAGLAGDAGLVMDSITGQGMGHALRDADLLSDAIITGLGSGRLDRSLARYAKQRDAETKAMFDFTVRLAVLPAAHAGGAHYVRRDRGAARGNQSIAWRARRSRCPSRRCSRRDGSCR